MGFDSPRLHLRIQIRCMDTDQAQVARIRVKERLCHALLSCHFMGFLRAGRICPTLYELEISYSDSLHTSHYKFASEAH